jgi:hypothetical protein
MRKTVTMVLAPVLLVAGCGTGDPAAPLAPTEPAAASVQFLPISGRCQATFESTPIDFLPPPLDFLAAHSHSVGRGTCWISHLGKVRVLIDELNDFTSDPFTFAGSIVFTAPNGDQLRGLEIGEVTVPPGDSPEFQSEGTNTLHGGTGRFAHASGQIRFSTSGIFDVTTQGFTISRRFAGTISYNASDRGHRQ